MFVNFENAKLPNGLPWFPIVGSMWGHGGHPTHPAIFFENPHPIKTDAPNGAHPLLKNEAPPPSEKHPCLLLKRKIPYHEMIPRKSTINDNLKSS